MAAEDPIAVVEKAFRDFEFGRTNLEEYFARYWHPDGVIESVDGFPIAGRYQGLEGYRRWFEDSYGPYDDIQRHVNSVFVEGESVIMLLTITGRSRDDDLELEVRIGSTYEVEDGRIRRLCVYVGHERALEAVRAGA
jgi:ketosteroid isomerase-like protein